jgi:hypothetical protein
LALERKPSLPVFLAETQIHSDLAHRFHKQASHGLGLELEYLPVV